MKFNKCIPHPRYRKIPLPPKLMGTSLSKSSKHPKDILLTSLGMCIPFLHHELTGHPWWGLMSENNNYFNLLSVYYVPNVQLGTLPTWSHWIAAMILQHSDYLHFRSDQNPHKASRDIVASIPLMMKQVECIVYLPPKTWWSQGLFLELNACPHPNAGTWWRD